MSMTMDNVFDFEIRDNDIQKIVGAIADIARIEVFDHLEGYPLLTSEHCFVRIYPDSMHEKDAIDRIKPYTTKFVKSFQIH